MQLIFMEACFYEINNKGNCVTILTFYSGNSELYLAMVFFLDIKLSCKFRVYIS